MIKLRRQAALAEDIICEENQGHRSRIREANITFLKRVNMEVTENVRMKVHALAAARGITNSELLESYIDDDYEKLPSYQR